MSARSAYRQRRRQARPVPPPVVWLTPFGPDLASRPRLTWVVFAVFYGLAAATAAVAALLRGN